MTTLFNVAELWKAFALKMIKLQDLLVEKLIM